MSKMPDNWEYVPTETQQSPEALLMEDIRRKLPRSSLTSVSINGRFNRFRLEGDRAGEKSGWYVAHANNDISLWSFGDWRTRETYSGYNYNKGRGLSDDEREALFLRMEEMRKEQAEEGERKHKKAAALASNIWNGARDADSSHEYLARKGVKSHGLKQTSDKRLIMPIYNINGELSSLQYISPDGKKRFLTDGEIKGGCCVLQAGNPQGDSRGVNSMASLNNQTGAPIYVVEGYATGASVYEALEGRANVVIALNAGNLLSVAQELRSAVGAGAQIAIVGDNDASGVGQDSARKAGDATGAAVIIPPVEGDANDYAQAGQDLRGLLTRDMSIRSTPAPAIDAGPWLVSAEDFCAQPAPLSWYVKGYIQRKGLHMIFGASGAGKTFIVLDWILRVAAMDGAPEVVDEWAGNKVRHAGVIYLAGEGHTGLKARIRGWLSHHDVTRVNAWVSQSAIDLNTTQGLRKTIDEIRGIETAMREHGEAMRENARAADKDIQGENPNPNVGIIVIDTLHRFLLGDENKAQDTKTFLDACAILTREFNCAVLLVHHTGVSSDAQLRARGSSSWKGALDMEFCAQVDDEEDADQDIGVYRPKRVKLVQTKSKDCEIKENLVLDMNKVEVPGWIDEDGEPVTTIILTPSQTQEGAGKRPRKERGLSPTLHYALMTYREAAETKGRVDAEGNFKGVHVEDWRGVYCARSPIEVDRDKRSAFNKARKDLVNSGNLSVDNDMYRPSGQFSELEEEEFIKKLEAGETEIAAPLSK